MAAFSHSHLCPTSTTLVLSHTQHTNRNVLSTRLPPVRRTTAPPVPRRRLTRPGPSFTALGSIDATNFQALAVVDGLSVLRGWWILMSLPLIAAAKIPALHDFLLPLVGRGKILESSSNKASVPQKFFCHFYVVGVVWNTLLLIATWMYAVQTGYSHEIWKAVFLLLLMEAQALARLFETLFVFKYSPSARMHIVIYIAGILFYITVPLSLCYAYISEVFKFAGRWFMAEGMPLPVVEYSLNIPFMQLNWYVWIGAAVFFYGWVHQRRCHAILGSLRGNKREAQKYAIPHGDWFEYVSSPHYLAEIVIYVGHVIASGFSDITIWLLLLTVVANLTFVAVQTHKWYLRKFDDYPKNRRAIIPFLF